MGKKEPARRSGGHLKIPVAMRLPPEIYERIAGLIKKSGRSLTAEVEARVEASFRDEDVVGAAIDRIYGVTNSELLTEVFGELLSAITEVSLEQRRSPNWFGDPGMRKAFAFALRSAAAGLAGTEEPPDAALPSPPSIAELLMRAAILRRMNNPIWLAKRRARFGDQAMILEAWLEGLQTRADSGYKVVTTHTRVGIGESQ